MPARAACALPVASSLVWALCAAASQCGQQADTDVSGSVVAQRANVTDPAACCALCGAVAACRGAVLYQGTCYMKDQAATYPDPGRVAVLPPAPPATLPPAPPGACPAGCQCAEGYNNWGPALGDQPAADAGACCAACSSAQGCAAFVFSYGRCYLKQALGEWVADASATSGVVAPATPAPAPATPAPAPATPAPAPAPGTPAPAPVPPAPPACATCTDGATCCDPTANPPQLCPGQKSCCDCGARACICPV